VFHDRLLCGSGVWYQTVSFLGNVQFGLGFALDYVLIPLFVFSSFSLIELLLGFVSSVSLFDSFMYHIHAKNKYF